MKGVVDWTPLLPTHGRYWVGILLRNKSAEFDLIFDTPTTGLYEEKVHDNVSVKKIYLNY